MKPPITRALVVERLRARLAMRRSRARAAGLLPLLQRCDCGRRIASTSRWGTICSICAKAQGLYRQGVGL